MIKFLLLFSALFGSLCCIQLTEVSYKSCDDTNTLQSIKVEPCDVEPCHFTKGQGVHISADFKPHENSDNCVLEMKAFLGDWVPVETTEKCGNGVDCPLKSGSVNTIIHDTDVEGFFPTGELLTRWKLVCDGEATEIFCAEVKIIII